MPASGARCGARRTRAPGARVITKRAAVSTQAIIVRGDSPCNVPQDLANVEVAVNFHAGSHYITLGMLSGYLNREEVKTVHVGIPNQRFKAVLDGTIQAAAVMEPWISAGEKLGCKVICEAFYNGLEVADTSVDADIFTALHRAHIRAVDRINQDIRPWLRHLTDEVPPDIVRLEPSDLHLPRLRYNHPGAVLAGRVQAHLRLHGGLGPRRPREHLRQAGGRARGGVSLPSRL